MRVGTPGFSGQRLREAREARGLTAISVSELAEVSVQAVYHYESGRMSPSPDVLEKLAVALNLPPVFFLLPDRREVGPAPTFFRSMSAATKGARNRARHRLRWLQDIVAYASDFVALPDSNFPDLDLSADPIMLSDAEIEQAAEDARRYWRMGDGPIANMILLLENQGAIVARDQLGADTLDGLSQFIAEDERPYMVIGVDKGSPARWRFDAAHELGHMLIHANIGHETLDRPEMHRRIEEQANHFARAFLLPLGSFGDDLFGVSLDAFRAIKPRWNVSIAAMIFRARDAGLLSEDTERKLRIGMSRHKWRVREPYDETTEAEEPRVLRRSFEMILSKSDQTPGDVTVQTGLPTSDIETLSALPTGYLSNYSRVALLPPATIDVGKRLEEEEGAQVISLSRRRHVRTEGSVRS
jgi:Zn-dependent peptidase ImmA (M78 family)/DNA-binding XRE family transcriptional regulator